jgi:hypothetical protein
MAYESKVAKRLEGGRDYASSEKTLTSSTVSRRDFGSKGPDSLVGVLGRSSGNADLVRRQPSASSSTGLVGRASEDGRYPGGPRQKRATEPGPLKPGTAAQAHSTVRMTPGSGEKAPVMKSTGTTPKALRGGKAPR